MAKMVHIDSDGKVHPRIRRHLTEKDAVDPCDFIAINGHLFEIKFKDRAAELLLDADYAQVGMVEAFVEKFQAERPDRKFVVYRDVVEYIAAGTVPTEADDAA